MNNNETLQKESRETSRNRYIIPAVTIALFCITVFVIWILIWEPKPNPFSVAVIREAAAA